MRRRWVFVPCVLVMALVLSTVAATSATTLFGTRFRAGETIQFEVQDASSWWWGCCCCNCCDETQILGWRITDLCGGSVYSVVHDAAVPASAWLGSWAQTKADGSAVAGGQYMLYVDTTAGTLSRCFTVYDPCACYSPCWYCSPCTTCACNQVTSITECCCKTSLVFVDTCTTGCFPFFGLFGCCSSCTTCP